MTTTSTPPRGDAGWAGSDGASRPVVSPVKARRRPMLVVAGIAVTALGGVAAAGLATAADDTTAVVALREDVARGEVIEKSDLTVAHITDDPALTPVPESDLDRVVGMHAANDLSAGSLLAPDAVTDELVPGEGESIVGVAVTPAQLPATELLPGDTVRIVGTPPEQGNPPKSAPEEISATVVGSRSIPDLGQIVVDVSVDASDAALLAASVATGRVAIILDGPG
jgi:hypothetical protein